MSRRGIRPAARSRAEWSLDGGAPERGKRTDLDVKSINAQDRAVQGRKALQLIVVSKPHHH